MATDIWESEDGGTLQKLIIVSKAKIKEIINKNHNGTSGEHLGITKS